MKTDTTIQSEESFSSEHPFIFTILFILMSATIAWWGWNQIAAGRGWPLVSWWECWWGWVTIRSVSSAVTGLTISPDRKSHVRNVTS